MYTNIEPFVPLGYSLRSVWPVSILFGHASSSVQALSVLWILYSRAQNILLVFKKEMINIFPTYHTRSSNRCHQTLSTCLCYCPSTRVL